MRRGGGEEGRRGGGMCGGGEEGRRGGGRSKHIRKERKEGRERGDNKW